MSPFFGQVGTAKMLPFRMFLVKDSFNYLATALYTFRHDGGSIVNW